MCKLFQVFLQSCDDYTLWSRKSVGQGIHSLYCSRQKTGTHTHTHTHAHTHTHTHTRGGEGLFNASCWTWTARLFSPLPVSPARVWLPAPVGQSLTVLSGVCGKSVEPSSPLVRYVSVWLSLSYSSTPTVRAGELVRCQLHVLVAMCECSVQKNAPTRDTQAKRELVQCQLCKRATGT